MADLRRPASSAEAPAFADWRRVVEKSLKGRDFAALASRTRDGILVEPLYPRRTDAPPLAARGAPLVDRPVGRRPRPRSCQRAGDRRHPWRRDRLALRFAGAPTAATSGLPAHRRGARHRARWHRLRRRGGAHRSASARPGSRARTRRAGAEAGQRAGAGRRHLRAELDQPAAFARARPSKMRTVSSPPSRSCTQRAFATPWRS